MNGVLGMSKITRPSLPREVSGVRKIRPSMSLNLRSGSPQFSCRMTPPPKVTVIPSEASEIRSGPVEYLTFAIQRRKLGAVTSPKVPTATMSQSWRAVWAITMAKRRAAMPMPTPER